MSERKFPAKSSHEAQEFLRLWDASDKNAKRALCEAFGSNYSRGTHIVKSYRDYEGLKIPKKQPVNEKIPWAEQIEIVSGLEKGVAVVESGGAFLVDGDVVRVANLPQPSSSSPSNGFGGNPPPQAGEGTNVSPSNNKREASVK
mgnify:CR=1 FL=1